MSEKKLGPFRCPRCGAVTGGNLKYCNECGQALDKECEECGASWRHYFSYSYCPNCGARLKVKKESGKK